MFKRCAVAFCAGLGLAWVCALPRQPAAADRTLEVTAFYVYPDDAVEKSNISAFAWPDDMVLNVLVRAKLGGFQGEQRLDLFLVMFDADGKVLKKSKGKHSLPAGEHDIVFREFFRTDALFGEHDCRLELEATLKGAAPVKSKLSISLIGPDPPRVNILDLSLFNPQWGRTGGYFAPGSAFQFEADIEIEENHGTTPPQLKIYGVVEEDSNEIDPYYDYQPYDNQWDVITLPAQDGEFRVVAHGYMPLYFAQPWDTRHPVRLYAIVDCGGGARVDDYSRVLIEDDHPGDSRKSDDVQARLIELDRSYRWDVKRLRGAAPGPHGAWQ
jgi:hypothetical protein